VARELLRIAAAAPYLRVSEWKLKQLAKSGEVAHFKIANKLWFDPDELDRWIAAQHVPAREPAAS
jgi:Helix-turn-helix domain